MSNISFDDNCFVCILKSSDCNDNTTFNFKLILSQVQERSVSVDFTTEEITAGIDIDFIQQSGTLTIQKGDSSG